MEKILQLINERNEVNTLELAKELNCDHQKIIGVIKSIESFGDVITTTQVSEKTFELTKEGDEIIENGSHEAIVYKNVPDTGIEQKELMANVGNPQIGKLGFSKAMSLGWIFLDKSGDKPIVKRKTETIDDEVQQVLQKIKDLNLNEVAENRKQELKKRKLIQEIIVKSFNVTKGANFRLNLEKLETDLTSEMIVKGTWKTKQFKDYNFNAMGIPPERGHLHPLLKVREEFRKIFFEMGFTEMPTNNFVEASFWNFDAIFQPQQHPARGEEDTFFLSDPACTEDLPAEFVERVRKVHTTGDYGSIGYRSEWRLDEAKKNILRTHTTAVSARLLYQVAQKIRDSPDKKFEPIKWFSIDRVFRNENLDATHLAEFHQIEGVIANVNISLGDIMGILSEFYKKLGMTKLKFKPAYNPYTEPSMEVFSYHEGLKKWVEIGNSGLFRPEMLLTMGLPADVSVIGYGLSLERPTMIKYGLDDIRDLVGHKVDLAMVYENPICILGEN